MATNYTPLLGFALPTTGELPGTWGTTVNDSVTELVEDAIAATATASVASGDWTLSTTGSGSANEARCAILIPTGSPGVSRNIIVPKQSKAYVVINQSNAAVVVKGSDTTGVTIPTGEKAIVAWNGSDFVIVAQSAINAVTSVTAAAPLASSGGATPQISISGQVSVANGGTGAGTFTSGGLLVGNGTSPIGVASASDIVTAIGSTAVTASTNLAGGLANQIPYQTKAGATSFITAPSVTDTYLKWTGSAFSWASAAGGSVTSVSAVSPLYDSGSASAPIINLNEGNIRATGFALATTTSTTTPVTNTYPHAVIASSNCLAESGAVVMTSTSCEGRGSGDTIISSASCVSNSINAIVLSSQDCTTSSIRNSMINSSSCVGSGTRTLALNSDTCTLTGIGASTLSSDSVSPTGINTSAISCGGYGATSVIQGTGSSAIASFNSDAYFSRSTVLSGNNVKTAASYSVALGSGSPGSGNSALTANRKIELLGFTGDIRLSGSVTPGYVFTDFAEMMPNSTGSEIPAGTLLALDNGAVRPANQNEEICGVVSHTAAVLAGDTPFFWQGRYLHDEWGRRLYEEQPNPDWKPGEGQTESDRPMMTVLKENPNWDPTLEQTPRSQRPAEWTPVGLVGQILVRTGENLNPGDKVQANNGLGVLSTTRTGVKVMEIVKPFDGTYGIARCLVNVAV